MDLDAAFASLPGLTSRAAQRAMADAVRTALEREEPLLVHAPTGVGKSLGYLVPIVAAGRRAIVATATKALQSQLIDRDLPRLADAFETTSALLMGRGNYLCLAGETRVITSAGVQEIASLAGAFHELLGGDGKWVKAEVRSFGVQRLMRLTLRRNGVEKVIHATSDHRWFVRPERDKQRPVEKTTNSLRPGEKLQAVFPRSIVGHLRPSPVGIAHGIVYGELLRYFPESEVREVRGADALRVCDLPSFFKDRPSLDEAPSYLLGWLAGHFAADGCVDKKGRVTLWSASLGDLEFVRTLCDRLGIATYGIRRQQHVGIDQTGQSGIYSIALVAASLRPEFFLVDQHRVRFGEAERNRLRRIVWTVVSAEPTDRIEEVYCAVVPTTASFALEDNILTGNCLAKADALVAATQLAATVQEEAALEVVEWAIDSETGSRLDAPPGTRDDVWDLVSTSGEDCPGQKGCAFFKRCFAERAKEQAREVDVVVTNHHLLLLELELRQMSESPGVMLPEVDVVVVDEAHRLAGHAADLYGVTVTGARVSRAGAAADAIVKASGSTSDWARRLRARWEDRASLLRPGPVLPGSPAAAELASALDPILREAQAAAGALRRLPAVPDDLEGGVHAARRRLTGLCRDLQRLREVEASLAAAERDARAPNPANEAPHGGDPAGPERGEAGGRPATGAPGGGDPGPEGPAALEGSRSGAEGSDPDRANALDAPGDRGPAATDLAVWVEERRDGGRIIRSALVEPGEVLREVLWDRVPATVACSATMAIAGELGGTAAALGVERPAGLVVESPFDFRNNALLYVPRGVPAPTGDGFQAAAERELRALVDASGGRALVLCTSWRAVESFASALSDLPWELLVQGEDTAARLVARFRDEVASVLVATRTFFEGVDVPGESLSLLVLDRLPFPRPDDPLLAERGRRIERRGGSKFGEVWLPSAAVSLQQALGRLIRSESDRGVMAVLDRRLADAGYARQLLVSLPPAPLTRSIADVRRFFGGDDPRR
jgi:Rad3-related DNA helicase